MEDTPEYLTHMAILRPNKRRKIRKYVNTWKPQHTNVVHLHLEGKTDDEIRDITGFSSTAIWNILRTPEAQEIKATVHRRVFSRGLEDLPSKIAAIQFEVEKKMQEFTF